jgi:hypothetical protein
MSSGLGVVGHASNGGLSWQGLGQDVNHVDTGKQTTRASSHQSGRVSVMLRLVCRWCILMSPFCKWSCSHCVEDWSDAAYKVVKFSLCCGQSYRSLSVALPDNRSTVIKNQVSLMTFPCKSIICKTCITRSINPVLQFRICWQMLKWGVPTR